MSTLFLNQGRDPFGALPLTFIVESSSDPQWLGGCNFDSIINRYWLIVVGFFWFMEELHRRAPCTGFWKRIWEKLKLEAFVSSCTLSKDGYNTCHLSCFVVPCAQRWHGGTKVCFVRGEGKLRWLDFLSPMQHHHGAQRSNWSMHRQCGPESAISTEDYHRLSMTVSSKVHLFRHLNFLDTQSMNVLLSFQSNPIFDDYIYIFICVVASLARAKEAYQNMASVKQRIWIVKPAEWANRGCGIRPMSQR